MLAGHGAAPLRGRAGALAKGDERLGKILAAE
jgi:hypothetical protein